MATRGKRARAEEPAAKETDKGAPSGKEAKVEEWSDILLQPFTSPPPAKYPVSEEFLRIVTNRRAEEIRPPNGVIYVCTREDKLVDVWRGLVQHGFLSVPVLQKTKSKYYGGLDLLDIVRFVVDFFGRKKLESDEDYWELANKDVEFQKKLVKDAMVYPMSRRNPFHPTLKGYSIFSVMELLGKEPGLHRVPIIDNYETRRLVGMITQSHITKLMSINLDLLGKKKNKTIEEVEGAIKPVISTNENEIVLDAFKRMHELAISGLAIVDNDGHLTGNLSPRDLKAISPDGRMFWRLFETTKNFLAKVRKEAIVRPRGVVFVKPNDTLETAIQKLAENNIHHIFVVDENKKPIGVISLKDILRETVSDN